MPSIFDALIQQESGGRAGAIGPKTKYGRALGLTQMLPATAAEMARKIGVPFDPSLLKDTSPQGAQYQRKLGEAYFNEGLERTGNERDALRYYHGGPDRAQWGPKTNKYADSVLARAGGTPMIRPRKPQPKAAAMQPVPTPFTGPDPLAPMPEAPSPLAAALAPVAPQADPLAPLPGGDPKKKGGIFGSGLNGWDILGSVADGYLLANGQQGAYTQGQRQEREMQFDREKFNQELEARRQAALAKAAEPPQEFQTADYYNRLPEAQRNAFLQARDAISPIVADIAQPDGSVRRSIIPRGGMAQAGPQPGAEEDGYVFMGGDPADPKNWKAR
jgi:uncharacterized membrane protein